MDEILNFRLKSLKCGAQKNALTILLIISDSGTVKNCIVLDSLTNCSGCEADAKHFVATLKKWKPAYFVSDSTHKITFSEGKVFIEVPVCKP